MPEKSSLMSARTPRFEVVERDTYIIGVRVTEDRQPVDITGWTVVFSAKRTPTDAAPVISRSIVAEDAADGVANVDASFPLNHRGLWHCDIRVVDPDEDDSVTTLAQFLVSVVPEITTAV